MSTKTSSQANPRRKSGATNGGANSKKNSMAPKVSTTGSSKSKPLPQPDGFMPKDTLNLPTLYNVSQWSTDLGTPTSKEGWAPKKKRSGIARRRLLAFKVLFLEERHDWLNLGKALGATYNLLWRHLSLVIMTLLPLQGRTRVYISGSQKASRNSQIFSDPNGLGGERMWKFTGESQDLGKPDGALNLRLRVTIHHGGSGQDHKTEHLMLWDMQAKILRYWTTSAVGFHTHFSSKCWTETPLPSTRAVGPWNSTLTVFESPAINLRVIGTSTMPIDLMPHSDDASTESSTTEEVSETRQRKRQRPPSRRSGQMQPTNGSAEVAAMMKEARQPSGSTDETIEAELKADQRYWDEHDCLAMAHGKYDTNTGRLAECPGCGYGG